MVRHEAFSCLVVTVLLGEEEKAGADLVRVPGQGGGWSLSSAPPGRQVIKAAQLKTDLGRCGHGEHTTKINPDTPIWREFHNHTCAVSTSYTGNSDETCYPFTLHAKFQPPRVKTVAARGWEHLVD